MTVAVVAILVLLVLRHGRSTGATAGRHGAAAARAVPVVADTVRSKDFDVHLTALGTVTPLQSVTVHSRVDGQLLAVHFTEGQIVSAGQLLANLDSRPFEAQLQQAQGQLARDAALLDNARIDLDRYNRLLELDSVAKQQVDTQEALVHQYQGTVKVDSAAVRNAALQLEYTRISSPLRGRVGLRLVDPGNIIHASDPNGITVITQLQPISVLFSVPQDVLPQVMSRYQSGQPLPVSLYGRDGQRELAEGRVATVDNEIDPTTGTVKVRADFDNDDRSLFPNQFVNVKLLLQQIPGATVVPSAAVQRGSVGTFTFVVSRQNTVSVRPVTLGPTEGDFALVSQGLSPGEVVVVDGVDQLRDGAAVQLLRPGAANGAGASPTAGGKQRPRGGHTGGNPPAAQGR